MKLITLNFFLIQNFLQKVPLWVPSTFPRFSLRLRNQLYNYQISDRTLMREASRLHSAIAGIAGNKVNDIRVKSSLRIEVVIIAI